MKIVYLLILNVLVYYQLLRDEQAAHTTTLSALREWDSWYHTHKKPQVQQLQKTIDDLKMTIENLTNEKVNRTPNNNNNGNNSNNYIIILMTI